MKLISVLIWLVFGAFLVVLEAQDWRVETIIVIEISDGDALVQIGSATDVLVVGDEVGLTALILPQGFARVSVLCPSGIRDVIDFPRQANCAGSTTPPIWSYSGLQVVDVRANRNTEIGDPHIIFPRNTRLLYGNPAFMWTPASNAATYHIRVTDNTGKLIWERRNIQTTRLNYPTEEPLRAFDPAGNVLEYIVRVDAYDASGILIQTPIDALNRGMLTVAPPAERREIERQLQEIDALDLPRESSESFRIFMKARLLTQRGFYADAYQLIESLVTQSNTNPSSRNITTSPTLFALLGDLYLATGLPARASDAYHTSLELSEQLSFMRGQAYALERLASLSNRRTDRAALFERALRIYEALSDQLSIQRIRELIR